MKRVASTLLLPALLIALCAALQAQQVNELKSYRTNRTPSEGLLEALKQLVGGDGRVINDLESGKLLILAPSNVHGQIEMLLAQEDAPAHNIRIDLNISGASSSTSEGASLGASGKVTVSKNGTSVRVKMAPSMHTESAGGGMSGRQSLVVADGEEASFFIGEEVPYFEWLQETGRSWGYMPREMTLRNVGASLRINPTILADGRTILVHITPELSGMAGKTTRRIRYAKAATTLKIRNGSTVSLAGLAKDSEFYRKFLVGYSRQGAVESLDMSVTATILDPAGRKTGY